MAFRMNQTNFLLGLLSIALVLEAGMGAGLFPGLDCQKGRCQGNVPCDLSCQNRGYRQGGTCIGIIPGLIECCCHKNS
ncbi:hypothetical protein Fmac_011123 [Flemingia macrophylla]|uniref:LCR n=1 Tax=Flemingia macrophylla TaxID=520843 RepID=A0ABD1MMC3_9FABA